MSEEKKEATRPCPECGGKGVPTGKTWPLTSPMALMSGKLIIMGTFECQDCGKKFRKKMTEMPLGEEEEESEED